MSENFNLEQAPIKPIDSDASSLFQNELLGSAVGKPLPTLSLAGLEKSRIMPPLADNVPALPLGGVEISDEKAGAPQRNRWTQHWTDQPSDGGYSG